MLFVSLFGFLLTAFPARNSDLLGHLVAGREILRGAGPAGNPSWLYDLTAFGLYSLVGGQGLVLAKGLLVAGLALLLLRLSRAGPGQAVPAACTALALLAMSMRLLLQPVTVSYLFLALTLWLVREKDEERTAPPRARPPWTLLGLFVVWVNVDGWFLLGLGVVALVWLGRALDERPPAGHLLRRAAAFILLVAACLLNPSHVHAFQPPADLGMSRQVTSPFQEAYWAGLGLSPAGLAYFPLLGLGALSFLLNLRGWRWGRFLPWAGLALLSAWLVRTIPFFAVVAGPALAWNVQELLARLLRDKGTRPRQFSVSLSPLLLVSLPLGLLVCAWPGWLQAPPYEPRRLGVELPPSLERGAAAVEALRRDGPPLGRALHLSAETANAFAWLAPEEMGVQDQRLTEAILENPTSSAAWARQMRAEGVGHLIVYDPDRVRLLTILDRLLSEPDTWPLLVLEGDLAVFGWRDPTRPDGFRGRELDLDRLAYHPADERKAPPGPADQEPEPRRWWEAFLRPAPARPIDRDEAALYLLYAEALRRTAPQRRLAAWEAAQSAGLAASASGWSGPAALLDAPWRLVLMRPPLPEGGPIPPLSRVSLGCQQIFALNQDDCPPALLFLAVRAALRALAVNPEDAQAQLSLGEGYRRLLRDTRERAWVRRVPELAHLRRAQASAALNQAVSLDRGLARAQAALAELYRDVGYLDLALKHLREYLRLTRPAGGGARGDPYEAEAARLAEVVAARQAEFDAEAGKLLVLDRASLAFEKGLGGKARDLLLGSNVAAFGAKGMALELDLLLRTGRVKDVREWTSPDQKVALGANTYHWLRTQAHAAARDYAMAEQECAWLASDRQDPRGAGTREALALLVGQAVLDGQAAWACWPDQAWREMSRITFHNRAGALASAMRQQAKADVVRGLLALEQGEAGSSRAAFSRALSVWNDGAGLDFPSRPIAEGYLRLLEGGKR